MRASIAETNIEAPWGGRNGYVQSHEMIRKIDIFSGLHMEDSL